MSKITIGADPEIFLVRDGELISGIDKIGGTKVEPRKLFDGIYAVQEDNVSWEYNIPPCDNAEDFACHNMFMLGYLAGEAAKYGCGLAIRPSGVFSDKELDHPMAHVFGCDADFDAWDLVTNPKPFSENKNLRSAGGHIHVGIECDKLKKVELIRVLDVVLGVALNYLEPPNERAQLYGKPGAMRMKPYGVEWRTPSNFWLTQPLLIRGVGDVVLRIANSVAVDHAFIPDVEALCNDEEQIKKLFATKQLPPSMMDIAAQYYGQPLFAYLRSVLQGTPKKKAAVTNPKNTITDKILEVAQVANNPDNDGFVNIFAADPMPAAAAQWADDPAEWIDDHHEDAA